MNNNCIKNLLKVICLLQENSNEKFCCDNSCTKPYLGPAIECNCYNTRVLTLYKKNGERFTTTYDNGEALETSPYFRVSSISNDCCTLLILKLENGNYYSTKQSITVNLRCICAVKCIDDIFLDNL